MKVTKKNLPIVYLFLFFFIFLIIKCILRPLRGDTFTYHIHYLLAQENICLIEPSFYLISKICYKIAHDVIGFRLLISIYAIIDAYILLKIFKKSKSPLLCFLIFYLAFYNWFMCTLMRASVAYLICFSSLYDIAEQKRKKAFVKILIATLFHYSVCWFLVILPLEKRIKNKKQLKRFSLYAFFAIIIGAPIMNIIFSKILPNNYILEKLYSYYTSGIYYLQLFSLKSIFLFIIYYYFLKYLNIGKISRVCRISLIFISFSIVFHFFGVMIMGEIGSRLRDFVYVGLLIFAPEALKYIKNRKLLFLYFLMGFLFFSIKESNLVLLIG